MKPTMYKWRLFMIVAVSVGVTAMGSLWLYYLTGPVIIVDNDKVRIDEVKDGQTVVHSILVRNGGFRDLKIARIWKSCNCVEVRLHDHIIKAGKEGRVDVVVEGHGTTEGMIRLALFSNDRDGRVPKIAVTYQSVRDVDLRPMQLDFGRLEQHDLPQEMALVVQFNRDLAKQVGKLSGDGTSVGDAHVRIERGETSQQWILKARLEANTPCGEYLGSIRLSCTSSSFKKDVPFYAYIASRVFGRIPPVSLRSDGGSEKTIVIPIRKGAKHVLSATATVSGRLEGLVNMDVQLRDRNEVILHMTMTRVLEKDAGRIQGHIRIEANLEDGEQETLRIPLRLVSR